MNIKELTSFANEIKGKFIFDYNLKKLTGLILEEKLKLILNLKV